jgi:raffinose/stachyose/melibiose transport system permease protein
MLQKLELSSAKLRKRRSTTRENRAWYLVFSVLIGLWCLITVVLLLNIFISSFKTNTDIFKSPWSLPGKLILGNYTTLIDDGFLKYYLNSFIILAAAICMLLALSAPAAYGLGKFKFKGNRTFRMYFLLGMMFPLQLGIIPLFGLINSIVGVIIIYSSGVSIPVFILTNFTQSVPDALREAAKIDGASEFTIFLKIFLPLMMPAFGALIPLTAVGIWNEFFVPLVFISDDNLKTLPLGLLKYFTGRGFNLSKIGVEFAAVTISILPLTLIYLFGSKKIIGGLTQGAVK